MDNINVVLQKKLENTGVSFFGFAKLEGMEEYEYPHLPYGISIGVKLSDEVIQKMRLDLQQMMETVGKSLGDLKIAPNKSAADGSARTLKINIQRLMDSYAK